MRKLWRGSGVNMSSGVLTFFGQVASNIGLAFLGTSLFWVTVAGMAFRSLGIDFAKLEQQLKHLYQTAEGFDFTASAILKSSTTALLKSIYGSRMPRLIGVTLLGTASVNVICCSVLYTDYQKVEQANLPDIRDIMMAVDAGYYSYLTSPRGIAEMRHATESTMYRGGEILTNNDYHDVALRDAYEDFMARVDSYTANHGLSYEISLKKLFDGRAFASPWKPYDYEPFVETLVMSILFSLFLDAGATRLTIFAVQHFSRRQIGYVIMDILGVFGCFILALLTYTGFLHGKPLGSLWVFADLKMLILPPILAAGAVRLIWGFLTEVYFLPLSKKVLISCGFVLSAGFLMWILFTRSRGAAQALADIKLWVDLLTHGVTPKSVMLAIPTVFPLLAVLSLATIISLSKVSVWLGKAVFLGEVYGVSVLSGGTYFLGFMTLLITVCTGITSLLMTLLTAGHK